MPLVKIEIRTGKTSEYKQSLFDGIHKALVTALSIPDSDRIQRLYELDADHFEIQENKTDRFTLIEITMFHGRSRDAKKKLYGDIVNNLSENPGIDPQDIFIVLNEPPKENWGIRGGKPADEIDLGFKIDV